MEKMLEDLFSDKNVVVITGAGISTLSGIPDFRGKNGLYTKGNNVEAKLSNWFFRNYPDEFYEFYKNNMMLGNFEPNIVHKVLARLEEDGYISGIITQNIDNLHQRAGSVNVIDIHGNGDRYYCTKCNTDYSDTDYAEKGYKCSCPGCTGNIRPDIVLYGEGYDYAKNMNSWDMINNADVIIALGSSLTVSTVMRYLGHFTRFDDPDKKLYIINNQPTPFDGYSYGKRYNVDLGDAFKQIEEVLDSKTNNDNKDNKVKKMNL